MLFVAAIGCEEKKPAPPATQVPAAASPAPAAPAAAAPVANAAADPAPIAVGTKVKCPVTGEDFTVKESTKQIVHDGKRYAFCCADCAPDFKKDPAKYAKR